MARVNFNQHGFAVLSVSIRHKNPPLMYDVDYKVDSGANCTTINRELLTKLGYDKDWIKSGILLEGDARPTLASGIPIDDCYKVVLPEITIGDWVGYNWPFITSLTVPFRSLLGTDSMAFFNWHFDYGQNVCAFELIPGKRELLFNQSEQSIHAIEESA